MISQDDEIRRIAALVRVCGEDKLEICLLNPAKFFLDRLATGKSVKRCNATPCKARANVGFRHDFA
jgi:hypothetical protein